MKHQDTFKAFKTEFNKRVDILGLKDWDITIVSDDTGPDTKADCSTDYSGRTAYVRVNKSHRYKNVKEIRETACHEALHADRNSGREDMCFI